MKKIIATVLALVLMMTALTVFAETASQPANAFDEYDQKGYTYGSVSIDGNFSGLFLSVYFTSPDKTDCVFVQAPLTDDQYAEFTGLDFFDDNYFENEWKLVVGLPADTVTVTSLNDQIPSEEEVQQYAGKNVSELLDADYYWQTEDQDDDGNDILIFHNDDTHIDFAVTLANAPVDAEQLSDELIGDQVIGTIRFWGLE